jgi:hypothetical protein
MNYEAKWNQGISYESYRNLISELLENHLSTGPNQSDALFHYSELNSQRMHRLDKTFDPSKFDLSAFSEAKHVRVLVITEGWCGDASQSVPVITKTMASVGIEVRFVLRDEHPDLMDLHLVNGGRSIPVMILLDDNFDVIDTWGPRPAPIQKIMMAHKHAPEPKISHEEIAKEIQLWYKKDKQQHMINEWSLLFKGIAVPH